MQRISSRILSRISALSACAAVLAAAAPASAQTFDTAFINQVESVGNVATIEQIATQGGNHVTIDQMSGFYEGGGNVATVLQQGVGDSTIRMNQSGQMNDYTVRQTDGRNLLAFVGTRAYWDGALGGGGGGNTVMIEQSGLDSMAWVDHGFGASHNRVEVVQRGWGGQNQADVAQYNTSGSQASIFQAGGNLSAVITQSGGYGNNATIRQGY